MKMDGYIPQDKTLLYHEAKLIKKHVKKLKRSLFLIKLAEFLGCFNLEDVEDSLDEIKKRAMNIRDNVMQPWLLYDICFAIDEYAGFAE